MIFHNPSVAERLTKEIKQFEQIAGDKGNLADSLDSEIEQMIQERDELRIEQNTALEAADALKAVKAGMVEPIDLGTASSAGAVADE